MDQLADMSSGWSRSRPNRRFKTIRRIYLESPSIEALDCPFESTWSEEQNGVSAQGVHASLECSGRGGSLRSAGARPSRARALAWEGPGAGRRPCLAFEACAGLAGACSRGCGVGEQPTLTPTRSSRAGFSSPSMSTAGMRTHRLQSFIPHSQMCC